MNSTSTLAVLAVFFASTAMAVEPQKTILFCTGETQARIDGVAKADAETLLKISDAQTYVEIGLVGHGYAIGKPKKLSEREINSSFMLESVAEGHPAKSAQFTLNIYSGQLWVLENKGNGEFGTLFIGKCSRAVPLVP